MKFRLLLASVLMTVSVFGQNVPYYVPTNGLVGWWPFNGNANDESGNGNNGTVNGAMTTTDRFGIGSAAFSFDGVSSGISLTNNNLPIGNSSRSISVWFKMNLPVTNPLDASMIRMGNNTIGQRIGLAYSSNQLVVEFVLSTISIPFTPDSNWHQMVVTYPLNGMGSNSILIYLDGVLEIGYSYLQPITSLNTSANPSNGLTYSIGELYNLQGYFWDGKLDDIGVWDRALTQQEITNLYNSSLPTSIPIINCPGAFISPNLSNGLVGWWPFCGDADDESGNGNNGTVNGATLTSDRFGNANSAYDFDGSTAYIEVPNSSSLNIRTMFTISLWYNSDTIVSAPYNPQMISKERYLDGTGFQVGYGLNQLTSVALNNDPIGPPVCAPCNATLYGSPIIPNQWNHLVAVWNNDSLYLYQNSVKMAQGSGLLPNDSLLDSSMPLLIGKAFSSLTPPYPSNFKGQIDDIGIWNRALDSSEVAQLYNTGLCTQTIAGSCDTLIFNANITGFNPVTYANQVKVYPNPAADNLVIDCGTNYAGLNGYSIRITNLLGQTVYNSPVTAQITNIQLTPPTWVNGTYVVQFVHPNGTVMETKRIIIQ